MTLPGIGRLVLGTVQLGLPYGRTAAGGVMSRAGAEAVLDEAWRLGIRTFDGAEAYGSASERLAGWLDARGRRAEAWVVTKVRVEDPERTALRLESALAPFAGVAGLTVLSHGAADAAAWALLHAGAAERGALAGQSVYGPEEVRAALLLSGVSRLQAPGNLFDSRSFDARGPITVPMDVRSVYLQGVLLDPPEIAERRAPGAGALASIVQAAAAEAGVPAAPLLVAVMMQRLAAQDRLVVGVDRPEQLGELIQALRLAPETIGRFRQVALARLPSPPDHRTLDPRTWPPA